MAFEEIPSSYADKVAGILRKIFPNSEVTVVNNNVIINGRAFNLVNLYKLQSLSNVDQDNWLENYLIKYVSFENKDLLETKLSESFILPRIQSIDALNNLSEDAFYVPFVNDTIIFYMIDQPDMMVSITRSLIEKWNISADEIDILARKNLQSLSLNEFKPEVISTVEGGLAAIVRYGDGYDSSRLLLPELFETLFPVFKSNFYAAIPARDIFICFKHTPDDMFKRLKQKARNDFDKFPYPISSKLFLVTRDGIAGTY